VHSFGYMDGVSQPAIKGVDNVHGKKPLPGQSLIDLGYVSRQLSWVEDMLTGVVLYCSVEAEILYKIAHRGRRTAASWLSANFHNSFQSLTSKMPQLWIMIIADDK
jgi:hypothetical protein